MCIEHRLCLLPGPWESGVIRNMGKETAVYWADRLLYSWAGRHGPRFPATVRKKAEDVLVYVAIQCLGQVRATGFRETKG